MPGNAEPLLTKSSKATEGRSDISPRFTLRWSVIFASSILLGIGCVSVVLVGVPRQRPALASQMTTLAAPSAPLRAPKLGSVLAATTAATLAPVIVQNWGDALCYTFTGGTCHFTACNSWRNSTCESGRCRCDDGCVDANGTCHMTRPELVASHFTIKNRRWSDQFIYVPSSALLSQLRTCSPTAWHVPGMACVPETFNLYKVPGHATYNHDQRDKYFLRPNDYPAYIVGVSSNGARVYHADKSRMNPLGIVDPKDMMISLCASAFPGAVKIEGIQEFVPYIPRGPFHMVDSRVPAMGNADDADLWIPDPPFTFNVQPCASPSSS